MGIHCIKRNVWYYKVLQYWTFFQYKQHCSNVDDTGLVSDELVEKLMTWKAEYQRGKSLDETDVCSDHMRSPECVIKEENMSDWCPLDSINWYAFFLSPSIYIGHIDMGFNTDKWTFAVIVDDQARLSTANLRKAPMISIRPVDFDACCVLYVLEFVLFFF